MSENLTDPAREQEIIQENEERKGRARFRKSFLVGVILGMIALAFFAGYQKGRFGAVFTTEAPVSPQDAVFTNTKNPEKTIDFSLYWRVWDLLKEKYVDRADLDAKELFYGAIDGMLAATGDPYTTFFSPEENREFQEDLSGSFEGIGAEMALKDGILTIVSPLDDSPAQQAGLQPNDRVLKINGEVTTNLSLDEAVKKIRGRGGTEVTLTIFRDNEEEPRDVTMKRDVIVVKSVKLEMKEEKLAVVRISRFGDDTASDFAMTVRALQSEDVQGIILDLRNNPGGFLESAVTLAHHFLPDGSLVVLEENASGDRKELRSSGRPALENVPLVILINEGSASASEILAGALRESRNNVTLVGKKSFGKGSVQELVPVGKDTSVKITVARWLTPKGNQINNIGISPDVEVNITREDIEEKRDPQLDRALEILKEKL